MIKIIITSRAFIRVSYILVSYISIEYRHLRVLEEFDKVVTSVNSMHNSNNRSVPVAVAILCAKMRLGVSNDVSATMFHIYDKRAVSRIIHQVPNALINDFAPAHIEFGHISRHSVLEHHQTTFANALFTDDNQQVVVVMDRTYFYLQKSIYNELQRRTYSIHKHHHLIKPMIVTTTVRMLCFRRDATIPKICSFCRRDTY